MNKRLVSIVEILLKENKYITVKSISEALNVCNKTIRNDLILIEKWICEFNLTLDKKTGIGVAIRGDEKLKLSVLNDIIAKVNVVESFSPEDRRIYILEKLFTCHHNIRIKELSQNLYVSRATIHKDLVWVSKWLDQYKITLIRQTNHGLEMEGKEKNFRKAIYSLVHLNKSYSEIKDFILCDYSKINAKSIKNLRETINIDFQTLKNIILSLDSFVKYNLSDESLLSLLIHIAISIKRISSNKNVILSEPFLEQVKNLKEFSIAEDLCKKIEKYYDIEFSDDEISYLLIHILACKKSSSKKEQENISTELNELNNEEVVPICKELIEFWADSIHIPLNKDLKLQSILMQHLNPAITRIKYGLTLTNPLLDDIKELYPKTYNIVERSSYIFKKYISYDIDENEIGFLTLHLACAIDRFKTPLKTLVICHCGVGASQLLVNKLKQEFNLISVEDVKSSTFLTKEHLENIDLIISTVPLNLDSNVKLLIVSPLLKKQDIMRLNHIIKNMYTQKNSLSLKCEQFNI